MSKGLRIARRFTHPSGGQDVFSTVDWETRTTRITDPDGKVVFEGTGEVPAQWSQVAADIMVSKYFRRAGTDAEGGGETSARQVVRRLTGCWRDWGERHGYFATAEDAAAFQDELDYMLLHQMAAPNSPQWFNTGLAHTYGITGPAQGHWYVDPATGETVEATDAYSRPQPHACFVLGVQDDLVNPGGIMDLWTREARIFKFGAGAGANFSRIRGAGEPLSGGGTSSGLMSFLKVGDRAAGAIKSGGTTRRAAKMVVLDLDHPDIEAFVSWKAEEERKVAALVAGGYSADFEGEAYNTVSGQNANNSVRVPDAFFEALDRDGEWELVGRVDGKVMKRIRAVDLWERISRAAWESADPGVQYDTTINNWHTCPEDGRINASNPCFTGDALVHTDRGLIRFDRLLDRVRGGETFGVYTHDCTSPDAPAETLDLTVPDAVMVTGVKDVLRLRFDNGMEVRCTPNHRFWTANRGWVRADALGVADTVRVLDRPAPFSMADMAFPVPTDIERYRKRVGRGARPGAALPEKWSEDFAHYLGWLTGDGCVSGSGVPVTVYGDDADRDTILPRHRALLAEVNGGETPKPSVQANGTLQLRGRPALGRFCEALGVRRVRAHEKAVPWAVFEAPPEIVAAYLRGLFDADACVYDGEKSPYVGLGSASRRLLGDVQRLLATFGIFSRIYETRGGSPGAFRHTRRDGVEVTYDTRSMYDLRISSGSVAVFAEAIGFSKPAKAEKLGRLLAGHRFCSQDHAVRLVERVEDGTEVVYNLSEPKNHSYVVGGLIAANCSEYLFLDDSACNLASLNLVSFQRPDGSFDVEGYRHAIRLWTVVLEISVLMAAFPSREIARKSHDFRTLGLGYANLGSLLMRQGIAYDSDAGRAICGALTSILTGDAYAASAELAAELGPFARFEANREHMLRVIRNHRRVAYDAPATAYEGLSVTPTGVDEAVCPADLLSAARHAWDRALATGEAHGYRNAQISCLAPTGTIGLLMDCDTTGVEPDFALVKFKKLAGGGYFKIVNAGVAPALRHLGYDEAAVERIITYVVGSGRLDHPVVGRAALSAKGLTAAELDAVEAALPGAFDLSGALAPWVLGPEAVGRLGLDPDDPALDLPAALGFDAEDVRDAGLHICGHQTVEGAPGLDPEHLSVFDCANRCGDGERFIAVDGHIEMMAAAQPSLSGAISKTVNVPHEVGVEEIGGAYRLGWERGLKAVAIYRDGSKLAQPLNSGTDTDDAGAEDVGTQEAITDAIKATMAWNPFRRPMPAKRRGNIFELRVGDQKMYLHTGEYDDGTLGEMFIDVSKEGATLRSLVNCFAIAVSKGLQYGVPLEEFVDTFVFTQFEPRGMVMGHPNVKMSTSLVDAVFRVLGVEYLERYDLAHVPPEGPGIGPVDDSGPVLEATATVVDAPAAPVAPAPVATAPGAAGARAVHVHTDALSVQASTLMGDAPLCTTCGHITVRNGSCYRCLNCGTSMGCS